MPKLEGRRGSCPLSPSSVGGGGARIALHTELFPSLLSSERVFSGIVDSLAHKNFSGVKPPDDQTSTALLGDQRTKHYSSGKSLKTKIYPRGGAYIYLDVPSEKALPPDLGMHRCPCI